MSKAPGKGDEGQNVGLKVQAGAQMLGVVYSAIIPHEFTLCEAAVARGAGQPPPESLS
jgi:hypothetical protein